MKKNWIHILVLLFLPCFAHSAIIEVRFEGVVDTLLGAGYGHQIGDHVSGVYIIDTEADIVDLSPGRGHGPYRHTYIPRDYIDHDFVQSADVPEPSHYDKAYDGVTIFDSADQPYEGLTAENRRGMVEWVDDSDPFQGWYAEWVYSMVDLQLQGLDFIDLGSLVGIDFSSDDAGLLSQSIFDLGFHNETVGDSEWWNPIESYDDAARGYLTFVSVKDVSVTVSEPNAFLLLLSAVFLTVRLRRKFN